MTGRTFLLHPHQRKAVEDLKLKFDDLRAPLANTKPSRLHRPGQPTKLPPVVLVISMASMDGIYDAMHAKLRAGGFVVIDEVPFHPLPDVELITNIQLGKTHRLREAMLDMLRELPAKTCEEPAADALPAIRAQRIKPMKGTAAAQWKRERNGRGRQ